MYTGFNPSDGFSIFEAVLALSLQLAGFYCRFNHLSEKTKAIGRQIPKIDSIFKVLVPLASISFTIRSFVSAIVIHW